MKIMVEMITKKSMFQDNIIAVKYENSKRDYPICGGLAGVREYIAKDIQRIKYLKICWNCGSVYESNKHNSFACQAKCRQSLMYKLKRGINPPVRMKFHVKDKNVAGLKEMYNYQ